MRRLLATISALVLVLNPAVAQQRVPSGTHVAPKPAATFSADFGRGDPKRPLRRRLTAPSPAALGALIGSLPYVNGRGLFTGAMLQSVDQLTQQILAGLGGTWVSGHWLLPAPTNTALGGILSATAPTHQFQTGNNAGTPSFAQPQLGDVGGTLAGDLTGSLSSPTIVSGAVTAAKLATGAAIGNIGYVPLNQDSETATQALTTTPYGSNVATQTSFALKGAAVSALIRKFLSTHSMTCSVDSGKSPTAAVGCVTDFSDMELTAGGLQGWARNANLVIRSGFFAGGGLSGIGDEVNMNNVDQDVGVTAGDPSGLYPNVTGFAITAVGKKITGGVGLSTDGAQEFNRGFYVSAGSIPATGCTFCDYSSGSGTVLLSTGAHTYGIDGNGYSGGPFIRFPNGQNLVWRNAANSADVGALSVDGSNYETVGSGATRLYLGTNTFLSNGFQLLWNNAANNGFVGLNVDGNNNLNVGSSAVTVKLLAPLQLSTAYTNTTCTNAGYTTLQTSDGTTRKVMICN